MSLTVCDYQRAWERADTESPRLNRRLVAGTCVVETLSMAAHPDLRFVFVDDFGYATSYCRRRVWEDLTPPDARGHAGSHESLERWWSMRGSFATDELASAWAAADAAFSLLLAAFIARGYSPELGDQLRAVVSEYSLDLEIGEIYVLPQDLPRLLARKESPLATRPTRRSRARVPFDFANTRRRAALARWLREANQPA